MVANYDGYSHRELYAMVEAGHPEQVDAVAAVWNSVAATASEFARDLERDLRRLGAYWSGAAGTEYTRRVESMARFSHDISTESGAVGSRLGILAQLLREAQAKIENPADTDDHDKTASYAVTGAKVGGSILGPGGAIAGTAVGGIAGWLADDDEAAKAKARTVKLVQELAAGYEVEGPSRNTTTPIVPAELPTSVNGTSVVAQGAAAGTASSYAGPHGAGVPHIAAHAAPPVASRPGETHPGVVSRTISEGSYGVTPVGSGLAGAGDGGFVGVGGDPTQRGGFSNGVLRGPLEGFGGSGPHGTALAGAVGGVPGGGTALAGSSAPSQGALARPEVVGARAGVQPGAQVVAGRATGQRDEEPDERLTWLTEDDMDWGSEAPAPPSLVREAR